MANGFTAAQTGRTHDRTRPMLQLRQKSSCQGAVHKADISNRAQQYSFVQRMMTPRIRHSLRNGLMTVVHSRMNMGSLLAWLELAKFDAKYTVRTRCPQCGRKHITVFRLRHVSDSCFVQLGHFFRYARHFDFQRLRWCTNSGQHPNWSTSKLP